VTTLECPSCGNVGAVADAEGMFTDGQPLVCGCRGLVSCSPEDEPSILIDDAAVPAAPAASQESLSVRKRKAVQRGGRPGDVYDDG
jgi:hypothetical protein